MPVRTQPELHIVGALHIDEVATVQGSFVPAASNPVLWKRYAGGVGCNVARAVNTILRSEAADISVRFHTALGDDSHGQILVDRLQTDGLSVNPYIIEGHSTGRYSVVVDESGQLILGLADVQLAEQLQASRLLSELNTGTNTSLLLDANLSQACIRGLMEAACRASMNVTALTVSPSKAVRLLPWADKIDLLFCNRREAQALLIASGQSPEKTAVEQLPLKELADALLTLGFVSFVLTDAAETILVMYQNVLIRVPVPPVKISHNVNGAGDALAGASVAGWLMGLPLERAVTDLGLALAADVLSGKRLPLSI